MSLSIRHWLAERHIELAQLGHPSAQIAGIAFRIAQDMEVKSLNPFSLSALTDVLELPFKAACLAAPAISQLSVGLLRILSRKKPLQRNEGTWLAFQVAYLNALQGILEQEFQLRRPWVNRAEVPGGQDADAPLNDSQLIAVLKTLRPGRLSDSQAEQALSLVAESFLVQQMNKLAIAWFVANGAEETEAELLTQRLTNGLPGHLLTVIAENALPLAQLQKFVRLGNLSSLRDTTTEDKASRNQELPKGELPLNLHREYYRAGLACVLSEPLLGEPFALKDLYIPLKGRPLASGTKDWGTGENSSLALSPTRQSPVDLMQWAMSQLEDKATIAVIEANPGSGKTSFCQLWASQVAQELYPTWMPVVIRLRDVTLGQTLEQTLESAFPLGRFTDTNGWLSLSSPPCLLILDGLDELPRSYQRSNHLWTFMDQVMRFHAQDTNSHGLPRHKIILTSCCATLDFLTRNYRPISNLRLPDQLRRIRLEPLGQDEFRQWFSVWAKLQSKSIAQAYFSFLKHGRVFHQRSTPNDLAILLRRPLMLYLLGILHRDAWVDENLFQMGSSQVKFEIYDRMTRWLLGEPAAGSGSIPELSREGLAHATRSQEAIANLLQGRHPQELRHKMQVAALTIIQTGQSQVSAAVIQRRLTGESTTDDLPPTLPALFFRYQPLNGILDFRLPRGQRAAAAHSLDWRKADPNRETGEIFQQSIIQNPERDLTSEETDGLSGIGKTSDPRASKSSALLNVGRDRWSFRHREDLRPSRSKIQNQLIEFSHPSFGEYLAAEEIAAQLQAITQQVQDQYGEVTFVISSPVNVAQHLYALLGYGLLSPQIEELVIERLLREEKRNADAFSLSVLFKRLYRFYRAHCQGYWLDEGIAHQAHSQFQALHNPLNVLQIDAAVGLNVFLLLCSGAREANIPFWPCGNPDIPQDFDADLLLSFIGRCAALSPTAFWQRARQSLGNVQLAQACLNQALFTEATLWQANLSTAELVGINLAGANLQNANLSGASLVGANLSNANLSGARLEGADLSGANLIGANLKSANLTNACLFQTQLDEQSKNFAIKSKALFSPDEFQAYNQSLAPTKIIGNLEDEDIEEEPTIFIESAEGEPMLPERRYSHDLDDYDDYEGETAQIEDPDRQKPIFYDDEPDESEGEATVMLYDSARDDL